MLRKILSIVILICFIGFSHHRESATPVKTKSDAHFSALNAFEYLKEIAKEPHPIGSLENHRVRDYLVETLKAEGLDVKIESGYTFTSWKPSYKKMAYVENVVATLKGSSPHAKKVILAGHYDSVVEGPGAADDCYSVASMIETAKLLKNEKRNHDLVLLITDGEEYGLLGAQYHVENNDMDDVALVLNYEARGNEGPGIAFEWSENNAWIVNEVAKCYNRPIANSLSFEIYKRMPNGSDFSEFSLKKIPGVNHAFIDGFSYYHHPQDNLEKISLESVQHTGENMYLASKHFLNYDFKEEKEGNATFFNFYGVLIHYSGSLDMLMFILCLLFASIAAQRLTKDETVTVKKTLFSFISMVGILLLTVGLGYGLSALVKLMYPQYSTFYSYHYYNHETYLIAGIGLSVLVTAFFGNKLVNRFGSKNLASAVIVLLAMLSLAIYLTAPTGTYVMMYPMAALSLGIIAQEQLNESKKEKYSWLIGLFTLIVVVGFWTFFTHSLYLAFSLNMLAAAILPPILFSFLMYGLTPYIFSSNEKILMSFGFGLFVVTMVLAHIKSKPTKEAPLKSNLFYLYDNEQKKTFTATYNSYINEGHQSKLEGATKGRFERHLPYSTFYAESSQDLSRYNSRVDSVNFGSNSSIRLIHPEHAFMLRISTRDVSNIDSLFLNDKLNMAFKEGATGMYYSPIYGFGLDSIDVRIVKRDSLSSVDIYLTTEYLGLPEEEQLPDYIIRNGGMVHTSKKLTF